jgi:hypothetical protein
MTAKPQYFQVCFLDHLKNCSNSPGLWPNVRILPKNGCMLPLPASPGQGTSVDAAFNGAKPVSCSSLNSLATVVLQIVAADLFSRQRLNADQEPLIWEAFVCELPVPLAAASTRWPSARPQRPGVLPLGAEPCAAGDQPNPGEHNRPQSLRLPRHQAP